MALKQLLVIITIIALIAKWCCRACLEDERIALLQLKPSFDSSLDYLDWGESANCCIWDRVKCDSASGHVTKLDLSSVDDWQGKHSIMLLNNSLFLPFKQLIYLDLSYNKIIGCVENEGFEKLAELSNLKFLDLGGNSFNSSILSSLSSLSSLNLLDLQYNGLKGTINLGELSNLINLKSLSLSGNEIEDITFSNGNRRSTNLSTLYLNNITTSARSNLLQSLGAFSNLRNLHLEHSDLRGARFGLELYNFTNLEELLLDGSYLDENFLQSLGTLPSLKLLSLSGLCSGLLAQVVADLSNLKNVETLELSYNFIHNTSNFFQTIETMTSLKVLSLHKGRLTGILPSEGGLCNLKHLQELDMSYNDLRGNLPWCLANLTSLEQLDLSSNHFSGQIPFSFGDLSTLNTLDLSNNQLSGEIPENLATGCFSLRILIISNNNLQGQIFPKHGNLQQLQLLELDGNLFNGTIPHSLSNCSSLRVLDVKNNQISGEIQGWLGDMPSLEILDVSMNNISRSDLSCSNTSLLKEVHLSKNMLQGSLAYAFGNCFNLRTLDLSHNTLVGSIPKWIEKFSMLSYLLLSHNSLTGEIPIQVSRLHHLRLIDLSNNHFSGHIPSCLGFGSNMTPGVPVNETFDGSDPLQPKEALEFITKSTVYAYEGSIPTFFYGIDLSFNNLTGQTPQEIGNLGNILALNLSYNHLSGAIPPTFSNLKQIGLLDLSHNNLKGEIPSQLTELLFLCSFSVAYNNLSGSTPERIKQFATFNNNSYEGNPFLCGDPLSKSCSYAGLPSPMQRPSSADDEDNGLIDMKVFYVSFSVSYYMVLLEIALVLCINPQWRRAWFDFIEIKMNNCYYFLVDNYLYRRRINFVSVVSLHSHVSSIVIFNGINFFEWREQVNFHLGVLELDLALLENEPASLTDTSNEEEKSHYESWKRSNMLSLMFMRMTIANNIKTIIPQTENAKEYLKFVEECFHSADKLLTNT